ncbi:MAG: tetratricopeptide repeat protein [Coprobacter sp.]|nr:tetratricopeptide repeat protein [Coprobacter sp.]
MKKSILIWGGWLCSLLWQGGHAQILSPSERPECRLERGIELFDARNYAGCIDLLTRFKSLSSDADAIREADFRIAASAYYRNDADAVRLLQRFVRTYPGAPQRAEAELLSGNWYFFAGEYASASACYERLDIGELVPSQQGEYLFRKGVSYLKTDRPGLARPCFSALSAVGRDYRDAARFYTAYIQYAEGRYDEALPGFLAVPPDSEYGSPALYYITQIHFKNGAYARAVETGEGLLSKGGVPEFGTELYRVLGESCAYLGDDARTVDYLSRYVQQADVPLRSSLYRLGVAHYRLGDYPAATEELRRVTAETDGLMQSAYLYLGQCGLKTGDRKGASMCFDMASQYDFDRQIQETALYNYALCLHETSQSPFGESVTVFEKFLNLFPSSRYADRINDCLVDVYFNTHNYRAALTSIEKIKKPDSKILKAKQRICFELGTEALINAQPDRAESWLTQAIALGNYDPEVKAQACFWRGECRYRKGEYDRAATDYRAYLSTTGERGKPIYALARYDLGYAYFKQHRFAQALEEFRRYAGNPVPGNAAVAADACARIGDCLYSSRQYGAAESEYARAVSMYPATGDYALFQQAFMSGLQKRYGEKITTLDRLLSVYPRSEYADDAVFEQGLTFLLLQNTDGAIQSFDRVIREWPQSAAARKAGVQLGMIYFNGNRLDESITAYKRVVSYYPGSEEARIAVDDLKSVYIEKNDVASYAAFLRSLNGTVAYEVSEIDSLSYLAAERAFMQSPDRASVQSLTSYLQSFPDGAFAVQAHYYAGSFYFDNGQYDEAWRELTEVRRHTDSPFEEDALSKMAEIKYVTARYAEALPLYRTLESKASSGETRVAARLGVLRCARQTGNTAETLAAANRLLADGKLSPDVAGEARFARAMASAESGATDDAVADLTLLAADPRTACGAEASYRLAQLRFDRSELAEAEAVVNQLIETGTPHAYWLARSFVLLADIHMARNDNFQARQYLLSLRNNYTAQDDIEGLISSRLQQIGQ